jgi:hypothetical protein
MKTLKRLNINLKKKYFIALVLPIYYHGGPEMQSSGRSCRRVRHATLKCLTVDVRHDLMCAMNHDTTQFFS